MQLSDVAEPMVVDGAPALWLKEPTYVTGGRVVVAGADEDAAIGLSVNSASVAAIDLKDASALLVRNKKYSAGALRSETLPMQVTSEGRLLVNAPGIIADSDARVADAAMTVFGGLKTDVLRARTVDVEDITSLNFKFVKSIAAVDDEIVLTHEDNTTSELPVGWNAIKNKPATFPVDRQLTESIPYLTNRVQLAQFNVDFLLGEVARLQGDVDSLERLAADGGSAFGPQIDGAAMLADFQAILDRVVAVVRSPLA
jgi:hypothetical protein